MLLREAESLYQNDFLFGFTLRDCTYFDGWQLLQGERLPGELNSALRRLAKGHQERAMYSEALVYARRLLSLDPLEESAHRLVMRLCALSGQRAAALRQYEDCRRILKAELDAESEAETLSLVVSVRDRESRPTRSATQGERA